MDLRRPTPEPDRRPGEPGGALPPAAAWALPVLRTPRLLLRPIRDEDAPTLLRLFGDADRMRFWGHPPLFGPEDAAALIADIRDGARRGDLLQWAISERAPKDARQPSSLIGTCTLAAVDRANRRAEMGIALLPTAEGSGFAFEAAGELLRHAFEDMDLHRVTADADPRNQRGLALLDRLGFRREGLLREHYRHGGEWQDGVLFGLLRSEHS